jgi:hypothetical protein
MIPKLKVKASSLLLVSFAKIGLVACRRTEFKNCSCWICKKRKPEYKKRFLERHRSISRQREIERYTRGIVPSYKTLEGWFDLDADEKPNPPN